MFVDTGLDNVRIDAGSRVCCGFVESLVCRAVSILLAGYKGLDVKSIFDSAILNGWSLVERSARRRWRALIQVFYVIAGVFTQL